MARNKSGAATELLTRFGKGESGADAQLIDLVYGEFHRLAVLYRRRPRLVCPGRAREPDGVGRCRRALHDSPRLTIDRHQAEDVIALDRALTKLATFSPRQSHIVELQFFPG